jgi:hypothetical protein
LSKEILNSFVDLLVVLTKVQQKLFGDEKPDAKNAEV